MIRKIASFKYAVFGLFSVALVSVACSDDDDAIFDGGAGKGGGGTSSGGKNATAGSSSSGATAGGTNNGGTAGSGTAGKTSAAGTGGNASAGTTTMGGAEAGGAGAGGEPDVAGGAGGAVSGGAGGAGGESGTAFVPDVLDNPGFEVGADHTVPTGWTNEGTDGAAYVEYNNSHTGFGKLSHYKNYVAGTNYTARTYQTVAPIANGTYSFSIWVDRNYFPNQHLFARGFNAADPNEEKTQLTETANTENGYFKITLSGIPVTSGTITVGVDSSVETGTYANFDDAELVLE